MKTLIRCAFPFLLVFACFAMISCRNPAAGDSGSATIVINLGGASEAARSSYFPPGDLYINIGVDLLDIAHVIRLYEYVPAGPNVLMSTHPVTTNLVLTVNPGTYVITISGSINGWPFSFREYGPFTLGAGDSHSPTIRMQRLNHSVLVTCVDTGNFVNRAETLNLNNALFLPKELNIRSFGVNPGNLSGDLTITPPFGFEVAGPVGPFVTTPITVSTLPDDLSGVNFFIRPNTSILPAGPNERSFTINQAAGSIEFWVSYTHTLPPTNIINIGTVAPGASGPGWDFNANILTIDEPSGANVKIYGGLVPGRRIVVSGGTDATITLNGINVVSSANTPALLINNGATVTLNLLGTNILSGQGAGAGIQTENGTELTIMGSNTAALQVSGCTGGAGIGGGNNANNGADIVIVSGTITATGGVGAAGIGGGANGNGGIIIINGGTVTAYGGTGGAGIGGGANGNGGNITISGGTVTANGATGGAGIGGGDNASGGNIAISGGTVTATSCTGGAGIGSGSALGGGGGINGGVINISGGAITATAGNNSAAAIGGGDGAASGTVTVSGTNWNYWTNTDNTDAGATPGGPGPFTNDQNFSYVRLVRP